VGVSKQNNTKTKRLRHSPLCPLAGLANDFVCKMKVEQRIKRGSKLRVVARVHYAKRCRDGKATCETQAGPESDKMSPEKSPSVEVEHRLEAGGSCADLMSGLEKEDRRASTLPYLDLPQLCCLEERSYTALQLGLLRPGPIFNQLVHDRRPPMHRSSRKRAVAALVGLVDGPYEALLPTHSLDAREQKRAEFRVADASDPAGGEKVTGVNSVCFVLNEEAENEHLQIGPASRLSSLLETVLAGD
jgi:hypothetical protein